mgnify:CR=1 FL=1
MKKPIFNLKKYLDRQLGECLQNQLKLLIKFTTKTNINTMDQFELKSKFTKEFFDEFQFDAEFRNIFESMTKGLSPYEVIEHLCKTKKELLHSLENVLENTPRKIIVTTERIEQLKDELNVNNGEHDRE